MPLLRGEPFKPSPVPDDLNQDEEVFVCHLTKEVFRSYDKFFNRLFLYKSSVWTCQHTGKQNLTFEQALKSEEDFLAALDSIQICHKKAMLSIVHHSLHTNINSLIKEVSMFFKERYITGEELDYHSMNGNKKVTKRVKILNVIQSQSPVKTSVIASTQPQSSTDHPQTSSLVVDENSTSHSNSALDPLLTTPSKQSVSVIKSTPASSPLSPDVSFVANKYTYTIEFLDGSRDQLTTTCHHLSRPRKSLTKEKIRLFLKKALFRDSEKSPYLVKPEFVEEYHLGSSLLIHSNTKPVTPVTPPVTGESAKPSSSRKRMSSQTSLDSFFSISEPKKPPQFFFNPLIGSTPKIVTKPMKTTKSSAISPKKRLSKGSVSKTSASKTSVSKSSNKSLLTPNSKNSTPKQKPTPLSKEVKKILKRSKSLKQLDVRKSLVKTNRSSLDSVLMMKRPSITDTVPVSRPSLADKLNLKEKLKQDRLKRKQELRDKRRMEKLQEIERMKPREDLLCEDSKPLPHLHPIPYPQSDTLFSEILTILEFLHHYGPAYNISDVIPSKITYVKLQEALYSSSTETVLFDLLKFLLQAIFSAMEEEHEDIVDEKASSPIAMATTVHKEEAYDGTTTGASGSRRSSIGSIPVEGLEDQKTRQDMASVSLASIKVSAQDHARWSLRTQASSLQKLALNVHTCSEVLRLHLMSCGGYKANSERQWFRFCNVGGYTDSDDPVIELRLSNPGVIDTLSTNSFFDMEAKDKALILSCLCSQLLMFSSSREAIEEILTQSKQLRKQLRELRFSIATSKKKPKPKEDKPEEGETGGVPQEKRSASEERSIKEEEEKRRAKVNEEITELEKELYPLTAAIHLEPLGYDRYYNKYWVFPSVPGLFVEHFVADSFDPLQSPGHPLITATENKETGTSPLLSEKRTENKGTGTSPLPSEKCTCTVITSPPPNSSVVLSHDPSLLCESSWSIVSSEECFQTLLSTLNPRGIREASLKQTLEKMKDMVTESISKCSFLSATRRSTRTGTEFNYSCANDCLELQLREQILDLEEKLYIGNLGYVRDVGKSRKEWRERIENSGAAGAYAVSNGSITRVNGYNGTGVDGDNDFSDFEDDDIPKSTNSVDELANVLLQIMEGIEKKYLLSPLGTAVDMKKRGKYVRKNGGMEPSLPLCVEQWKTSLQKVTSFAQIFVHLSTLERSVAWSKSLMNVRCRLCRRKGGDECMLLCDGCDHGYHTYCLRPPLTIIPEGDWFCNDCCPVTPVKRRRTVSMVSLKELSDSESDDMQSGSEDNETAHEDEETEEESDDEVVSERRHSLRTSTQVQSKTATTRGNKKGSATVTRSRKRLKLDEESNSGSCSTASGGASQAEMIISAIIDIRCSKQTSSSQVKAQQTLESQLCKALLEEVSNHSDSWPFLNPVRRRAFPDYHEVVTNPMDLKTIKHNLAAHKYSGLDEFLRDINQVFINCSMYHKRNSNIAKAGASLRKFVEHRYSDLGLGNLATVTVSGVKNSPGLRSASGI